LSLSIVPIQHYSHHGLARACVQMLNLTDKSSETLSLNSLAIGHRSNVQNVRIYQSMNLFH